MLLERLDLADIRPYTQASVDLGPGVTMVVGANAAGKTSLVEAIHYLSIGASFRGAGDRAMVRSGASEGVIRALARDGQRCRRISVALRPGTRNAYRLDETAKDTVSEVTGVLRSVCFSPEDLALVRGDPAIRRTFLDRMLAQRRPTYAAVRRDYERVVRQRNAALRAYAAGEGSVAGVGAFTEPLVREGANLAAARIASVHALAQPCREALSGLGETATVRLAYDTSWGGRVEADSGRGVPDPAEIAEAMRERLEQRGAEEYRRGVTLVGPHRDDLSLEVGPGDARTYASHGQAWSLALALRLASHAVLQETGGEPVVLLDDVFAALDASRRDRLARWCEGFEQVVVTAAVADDVPLAGEVRHIGVGTSGVVEVR